MITLAKQNARKFGHFMGVTEDVSSKKLEFIEQELAVVPGYPTFEIGGSAVDDQDIAGKAGGDKERKN